MKHFEPLMTYLSPWRTARVRMPETSEPASGSVRQNEASFGEDSRSSQYSFLTSSVAPMKTGAAARPLAPSDVWMPEQPHESSSSMRQPSREERPGPPYSSGMWVFINPTSWALSMMSWGQVPSLSYSHATGRISFSAKSCASSRRFFCSSVRVKSTTVVESPSKEAAWAATRASLTRQSMTWRHGTHNPSDSGVYDHQHDRRDPHRDAQERDQDQAPLLGKDGRPAGGERLAPEALPHNARM